MVKGSDDRSLLLIHGVTIQVLEMGNGFCVDD